jgi:hypothetical protein
MATVLKVCFTLYLFVLLGGGHVHGNSNGAAAGVYDVTEYGATPGREDNKDVSELNHASIPLLPFIF